MLPPAFWWAGLGLTALGAAIGTARYVYGLRPAWLELPMPAIYCSYFKTRTFCLIRKNASEELTLLLLLGGLYFLAFSRESDEKPEYLALRIRAWGTAILVNTLLLAFATMFIYGFSFIFVLAGNVFSTLALQILIFRGLLWRYRRNRV